MTVASRVAVMDEGRIIQVATPDAIYEAPNSTYVADFIGDVNLIKGTAELRVSSKPAEQTTPETIEAPADPFVDDTPRPQPNKLGEWLHDKVLSPIIGERDKPIKRLPPPSAAELATPQEVTNDIPEGGIALNWSDQHPAIIVSNGDEAQDGKTLTFAIRPEKLNIAKVKPDAANALQGTVIDIAYLGNVSTYHVELKGGQMIKAQMANARRLAKRDITWEDTVWVSFTDTAGVLLER